MGVCVVMGREEGGIYNIYICVCVCVCVCCGGWGIYITLTLSTIPKNKTLSTLCRGGI